MASSASPVVVKAGYSFFGPDLNRQEAEIPSELFTHLYAGFAVVDKDGQLNIPEPYSELFGGFSKTVQVRNPRVKTLLSIGGEGADLSAVVANRDSRAHLITDSIDLAKKFGFDGLDLCWLYPSKANQKEPLASLLIEWRSALDLDFKKTKKPANNLLLTAAVFHHPGIPGTDGKITFDYPTQALSDNLDWINVQAIDFYTPSNSSERTGPVHAWKTRPMDMQNRCGIKSARPATNKLTPMAYRDIQEELRRGTYETVYDKEYYAVYSHKINGEGWICYDDGLCIFEKVSKAIDDKLGGYFAWRVGADDVNWTLSRSN
ncbi:class V chitinase-like [Carya illinoinensis]|uniref:class V chitinase-like n=1 Tax=Carya illinoinensis TaxID=32201 RepID=UPI001C71B27E|nr:class V chitinase-like [Carya illinoinensis]